MLGTPSVLKRSPDGYRALDPFSHVLIPETLCRDLLQERHEDRLLADQTADEAEADGAAPVTIPPSARPAAARGGWLPLYDPVQAQAALDALPPLTRGNDRAVQERAQLKRLAEGSPLRRVILPGRDVQRRLQPLRREFPNFAEVLDAVERTIVLTRCAAEPLVLPPLLLVGDPGVGKSLFVERLTTALTGQPVYRVQVETSGIADTLIGTERHWSTSGPGGIFNLLVDGELINPLIMLDELDKAPRRREHAGLIKVLYAFLERDSARRFRDQSLPEVALDASHLSWLATANRIDTIERPLLDRLQVFHVPAPTPEQARTIVRRMDAALRRRYKQGRLPALPLDLLEQISCLAPRRAGKLLEVLLASLATRRANAFGQAERDLVQAELKVAAAQARAQDQRPPTEAEVLQGILTLSTTAAMKALEITGRQALMQRLQQERGPLH